MILTNVKVLIIFLTQKRLKVNENTKREKNKINDRDYITILGEGEFILFN